MSRKRPTGGRKLARKKRAPASRRAPASKRPTRRDLEARLRQCEERFAAFANLSADWIWEVNENLHYTFMHTRDGMTLGRPAKECIGLSRLDLLLVDRETAAWREHVDVLRRRQPFKNFVLQTSVDGT